MEMALLGPRKRLSMEIERREPSAPSLKRHRLHSEAQPRWQRLRRPPKRHRRRRRRSLIRPEQKQTRMAEMR